MMGEPLPLESLDSQYIADKNQPSTWLQTPPTQMPWSTPSANQSAIMRFTGDSCLPNPNLMGYTNPAFDMNRRISVKCESSSMKRKIYDGYYPELPPSKQLITEDKMAANLDGLHISNDYVAHQCGTVNSSELPGNTPTQQNTEESHMPTLVLCDELRRLTAKTVIPQTVMAKIERPTNALVLWQPPAGNLGARLQQIVDACKGTNQDITKSLAWSSFNNNNSSSEDMNDPNSKKNKQVPDNSDPEDSLMEI